MNLDKLTLDMAQELTVDMIPEGIWKAIAEEIGPANMIIVMDTLNGDDVYVPRASRYLVPVRNKRIQREYTGYNQDKLAKKYGVSTKYVRELCNPNKNQ